MNKIRIIDLLNKIANGEEVPVKIRIGALDMYWDGSAYWDEDGESQFCEVIGSDEYRLNREVEIIEEEKEIEEIKKLKITDRKGETVIEGYLDQNRIDEIFGEKINELIDAVNELKRGN